MDTKEQISNIQLHGVANNIEDDPNNNKLYLSVINSFKTYLYVIDPSSYQVIQKLNTDGYILDLGLTDPKFPYEHPNIVFSLPKGPNGIREFYIDEFGFITNSEFFPMRDFI